MAKPKKILIVNKEEVLLLDPLIELLEKHAHEITAIYYTPFFPPQAKKWDYILTSFKVTGKFYMLKYFIRSLSNRLKSTFLFPKSIKSKSSLINIANLYGIPCQYVKDINSASFIDKIKNDNIEFALSLTSQIYRKEIINIPRFSILNFHPSLLPNNKGRWPIFWAVVKGDSQGITCHEINEQLDAGAIIFQKQLNVQEKLPVEIIMEMVLKEIPKVISSVIDKINNGELTSIQSEHPSFYGPEPSKKAISEYWKIIG